MALFEQYNISPWLTPVRLCATTNQSVTYYNGPVNNGVKATCTYATGALTIDGVVVNVGDRILLPAQSSANQNGVYVCINNGATGVAAVLQRSADQQCIEQLHEGFYVTVGAGTSNAGAAFVMVEPIPAILGISNLSWVSAVEGSLGTAALKNASDNAQPTVASVESATVANTLPVFYDTAGSIGAGTTAATFGYGLTLSTGNFAASQGSIAAGSSGHAGTVSSFPATAANGSLILAGVAAGGAFTTTISNGTMGQSTVYSLGDIGASTGGVVVATSAIRMKSVAGASVAGGAAAQTITDAFCTSGSNIVANWNTQANAVTIQKIVPGSGTFVVTSSGDPGASTLNYIITK